MKREGECLTDTELPEKEISPEEVKYRELKTKLLQILRDINGEGFGGKAQIYASDRGVWKDTTTSEPRTTETPVDVIALISGNVSVGIFHPKGDFSKLTVSSHVASTIEEKLYGGKSDQKLEAKQRGFIKNLFRRTKESTLPTMVARETIVVSTRDHKSDDDVSLDQPSDVLLSVLTNKMYSVVVVSMMNENRSKLLRGKKIR
jgi:hypothetical protein